jgi:signal transduction histidine kinase
MLYEFVGTHRAAIIAKATRSRAPAQASLSDAATHRPHPGGTDMLDSGVPLFLTQLAENLRADALTAPATTSAIGAAAARHARDLLDRGYDVSQVVHHYGDVCQAITECALEQHTPITTEEFHALNGCLDTAIAGAVTEHARVTAARTTASELDRFGRAAHECRDLLNAALLAFQALKHSEVTINGSAGMVLGRSLMSLRSMIDSTLSEFRLGAETPRRERVNVSRFIDGVSVVAHLHAEYHGAMLAVEPVKRELFVEGDPQILSSAVMNLLINAFKYSRRGGRVDLTVRDTHDRVLIEVEDECGGLPQSSHGQGRALGEQRARERAGLGLGLSIARQGIRAHGGEIRIRNLPGKGCVFVAEVPLAAPQPFAESANA